MYIGPDGLLCPSCEDKRRALDPKTKWEKIEERNRRWLENAEKKGLVKKRGKNTN